MFIWFTIPRSKFNYCLYLFAGFFLLHSRFWPLFEHYRLSKTTPFGLNKTFTTIMLNSFFSSAFYFFMQILSYAFPYWQIPVHNQPFFQHNCSLYILGQSSSQRWLNPSFIQKAFSGVCISSRGVKRLWWVMKLHQASYCNILFWL